MTQAVLSTLISPRENDVLGDAADTFGRLIGSWAGEYHDQNPDGVISGSMEVHFAWALQGRAVQDTWIAPAGSDHNSDKPRMYGSTVRVYDPKNNVWRSEWFNPANNAHCSLVGRRVGDDIVQVGFWDDRPQRWRFHDIQQDNFRWQAHYLADDGETWTLYTEFHLARKTS